MSELTSAILDLSDAISTTEEIIEDARNGRMFILVDHEDRENEGDLVIPAQMATPEAINFMATHGRGLICLSLTGERVDRLGLPLMASENASRHETAFTVSIEAREGISTGISAHDRARTVAVAIDPSKTSADIATPGHVDGIGILVSAEPEGDSVRLTIAAPAALASALAAKGSITLDGISLTVNSVADQPDGSVHFGLNIIPHTAAATTLDALPKGRAFNLEIDVLARYLDRMLQLRSAM